MCVWGVVLFTLLTPSTQITYSAWRIFVMWIDFFLNRVSSGVQVPPEQVSDVTSMLVLLHQLLASEACFFTLKAFQLLMCCFVKHRSCCRNWKGI